MFNSGVLDVVVGLSFIYLLLSLIASAVSEIIEAKLRLRASDLERGIRELLGGKDQTAPTEQLYNHPLIHSLFLSTYKKENVDPKTGKYRRASDLPSYIPRRNFALALMDIVLPADPATGKESGVAGATPAPKGFPTVPLAPLRKAIADSKNEKLRLALLPLVDAAAGDVATARANIEDWFDSAMDRVSGWYKRRVQKIILLIGLVLTLLTNADTITIVNSLSRDVSMRNALVAAATEYAKAGTAPARASGEDTDQIPECETDAGSPECRIARNQLQLAQLGLPVGWNVDDERSVPSGVADWFAKVIGLLLTAIAISLGAPFWFDVLNKIIVVRSTVKPKEKSPDEPPVDRPKQPTAQPGGQQP
jgi:hypothetical protein